MGAPNNFKPESWISRTLDRKGADYFTSGRLTSNEVSRNAERIVEDIIKSRIDYNKYGQYLIMPIVLDTLINYCSNKLSLASAIQFSLGYTRNDYVNNYITHYYGISREPQFQKFGGSSREPAGIDDITANDISRALEIITEDVIIYNMIKQALQSVYVSRNPYELFSLTNNLNSYLYTKNRYGRKY